MIDSRGRRAFVSLRAKILFSVLIVFMSAQLIQTFSWLDVLNRVLVRKFDAEISKAVLFVKPALAVSVWEFDLTNAERMIAQLRLIPDYRFIRLTTSGIVFAEDATTDGWDPEWDRLLEDVTYGVGRVELHRYPDMVIAGIKLRRGNGEEIGEMAVGFALDGFRQEVAGSRDRAWKIIAIGTCIALVILALLARHITAPLTQLSDSVRRFSQGNLEGEFPRFARRDEIGQLSLALHEMHAGYREARVDKLTGLPNRRVMDDIIEGRNERTKLGKSAAMWIIDIDEFKPVNDGFGHNAGDHLLIALARRAQEIVGDRGLVLRLGGDEFGVVWPNASDRAALLEAAWSTQRAFCEPVNYHGDELMVGASIGVAFAADMTAPREELIGAADRAMYAAKNRATNKVEVYGASDESRQSLLKQRTEIERAIEEERFKPCYQPVVDLHTGRLVGLEALARLTAEDGTQQSPQSFLSLIEELGMQAALDNCIIRQVLRQSDAWLAAGIDLPRISVNLAEQSLASPKARSELIFHLDAHERVVPKLTVEITEDALFDRSAAAIRSGLRELADLGLRLSMDDFGTGYGSFRHLKEYHFDQLKIDRQFVETMVDDKATRVIVSGFVSIARGLDAEVVAEGIETGEQVARARELGCALGQGYLFSHPLDAAAATQLLGRQSEHRFNLDTAA